MTKKQTITVDEPLLQQEIILGMSIGVGILLLVTSEMLGMIVVLLSLLALSVVYLYRIVISFMRREEGIVCGFTWSNNGIMVLVVAGVLLLMLTDAFHRPVLYSASSLALAGLLTNAFFHRNIRGLAHITAQVRLVIAIVVMVVFYLL